MLSHFKNAKWMDTSGKMVVLAVPIVFSHVIEGLYPFVNTMIAAELGHIALAASGLAGAVFIFLMGFGWGLITSVGVLTAHDVGAGKPERTGVILKSSFLACLMVALVVMVLLSITGPVLLALGQDKAVVADSVLYFNGLRYGVLADFLKFAIFQYMIAFNKTHVAVIVHLISLPVLIVLNNALVYGFGPIPAMGMEGLGYGTAITYWFAFSAMLLYVWINPDFSMLKVKNTWNTYLMILWHVLRLGMPIGAMYTVEIAFFAVITLLMGRLGVEILAAHQIASQMLGMTILAAYGFAEAVSILVAKAAGGRDRIGVMQASLVGICFSVCTMLLVALAYWLLPNTLISFDLDVYDPSNEQVVGFAIGFLALCGIFQLIDAARLVMASALRGLQDSQYPMWIAAVSFWLIGLPIGYYLAFIYGLGGKGLWYGMICAVIVSLVFQCVRFLGRWKTLK